MQALTGIIAILAIFGTITAIVVVPTYLKSKEKRETQETMRRAIDKGQPLPPEVIDAMTRDVAKNIPSRTRDIRQGIIWLAIGVGIAAFSLVNDNAWKGNDWGSNASGGLLGVACIPATIGLAFIVLSYFNKNKD